MNLAYSKFSYNQLICYKNDLYINCYIISNYFSKCTDRSMFAILGMSGKSSSRATRRISKQPVKRASQEERERKLRNINNEEFSRSRFKFNTI